MQEYRRLFTRNVIAWVLVAFAARLPVAMAPLALVFLVRGTNGGYALGATLGAAYVVAEVVGSAFLGARLRDQRMRLEISLGLAVGAIAFAGLAPSRNAPTPVLLALAFLVGAAPAASPGGLRSLLVAMVPEADVTRALSLDTTLSQAIWAIAPALVAFLALGVAPGVPLVVCAVAFAAAAVGFTRIGVPPEPRDAEQAGDAEPATTRLLITAWPIYLTSAAAMALLATAELVLPALLQYRGIAVTWSGPLLTAFSVVSVVGGLCYGTRTWPGSIRSQSLALLVIMAAGVAFMGILPELAGIALGLLAAGFFKAAVMITRNLSLRDWMPQSRLAAGYSMMYAVQGVGYSLTATIAAFLLAHSTPPAAVFSGAVITVLLTLVSALAERARRSARLRATTGQTPGG